MHLTGDDSHKPGEWALNTIKTYLETKLATAPYAAQFAAVGGVGITTKHHEAAQWIRSKRPFIFLSFDEGDHQRQMWRVPISIHPTARYGTRHSLGVIAELVTPDAVTTVQQLRDAVGDIFDRNYYEIQELGFEEPHFAPDSAREAQDSHINPHAITGEVYSL